MSFIAALSISIIKSMLFFLSGQFLSFMAIQLAQLEYISSGDEATDEGAGGGGGGRGRGVAMLVAIEDNDESTDFITTISSDPFF